MEQLRLFLDTILHLVQSSGLTTPASEYTHLSFFVISIYRQIFFYGRSGMFCLLANAIPSF